jgi:hypothetical protein
MECAFIVSGIFPYDRPISIFCIRPLAKYSIRRTEFLGYCKTIFGCPMNKYRGQSFSSRRGVWNPLANT